MNKIYSYIKIVFVAVFILFLGAYLYSINIIPEYDDGIITEDLEATINELSIYGNNLKLEGYIFNENAKNVSLAIVNEYGYEVVYNLNVENIQNVLRFNTGIKINNQIDLEKFIDNGLYNAYLKVINKNNETKYYNLLNESGFDTTTYYTIHHDNHNKKITINSKDTLVLNVESNTDIVYDIILDAGHGGTDSGACYKKTKTCERVYTKKIANDIKAYLEKYNVKVALSWDVDNVDDNTYIKLYGEDSRVSTVYESNAKYLFSLHLNSSSTTRLTGFEIYTPYNVDYTFARILRDNMIKYVNAPTSNNTFNKVEPGIYTRTFSQNEIDDVHEGNVKDNMPKYDITTKTNYYFIIRETGGYMTGAYVEYDTPNYSKNIYANHNRGVESYIIEFAYINRLDNINFFEKNYNKYIEAVSQSILTKLGV